jgi:uncharacterized protein (TIGR03066 family)
MRAKMACATTGCTRGIAMRVLMSVVVSAPLLGLTACSSKDAKPTGDKPQDLIVGVWEMTESKQFFGEKGSTIEFKKGGEFVHTEQKDEMKGKYKFVEDDVIQLMIKEGNQELRSTFKAKLTKDDLELKDMQVDGREAKFKKKK